MCNHHQNIPGAEKFLPTWREFIGVDAPAELPDYVNDVWSAKGWSYEQRVARCTPASARA